MRLKRPFPMRLRTRTAPRGQTSVEFVLSILFLLLITFGTFEVVMLVYTYNVLGGAAKEGARYAAVHGCDLSPTDCSGSCPNPCTDSSGGNVVQVVDSYARLSFHDTGAMTVSVLYPDGGATAPNRVRIAVNYPYQPLLGLGWPTVAVHAAAEVRIVY